MTHLPPWVPCRMRSLNENSQLGRGSGEASTADLAQPYPEELVESLSDLLAQMLVNAWKSEYSQGVTAATVNSPGGSNRRDGGLQRTADPFPQRQRARSIGQSIST